MTDTGSTLAVLRVAAASSHPTLWFNMGVWRF